MFSRGTLDAVRLSMRKTLLTALAGLFLILLPASKVMAAPFEMDWTGVGNGAWATFSLAGDPLGTPFSDFVGEIKWNWIGTAPTGFTAANPIYAYCVDATQYLNDPEWVAVTSTDNLTGASQSFNNVVAAGGPDAGKKIAYLLDQNYAAARADTTGIDAAALQIAVWETLYDATSDLSGGTFQLVNSSAYSPSASFAQISAQANSDLAGLGSSGNAYLASHDTFLDTGSGQDQVVTGSPVPEPSSLILLGSGVIAVVRRRRRHLGAASAA